MGSFYGNIISHTPRFSFDIAKTYPNRATMEEDSLTDGVNFTQYVLVDYNIDKNGQYNESNYSKNLSKDQEVYGLINGSSKDFLVNYNQTVWQKSYDQDNNLYYRAIDRLHATLPTFQDMSAKNFPIEYMPVDYEGFGIEQLYGYYYTNDQESAVIFNNRYPDSEIQIAVDQDGSWNIEDIQNKIETKINEINESIELKRNEVETLSQNIEDNSNIEDLKPYYDTILDLYNKILESYNNVSSFVIKDLDIDSEQNNIQTAKNELENNYNNLVQYKTRYDNNISFIQTTNQTLLENISLIETQIENIQNEFYNFEENIEEQHINLNKNYINNISIQITEIKNKINNLDNFIADLEILIENFRNSGTISSEDASIITMSVNDWDNFFTDYNNLDKNEISSSNFTEHIQNIESNINNVNNLEDSLVSSIFYPFKNNINDCLNEIHNNNNEINSKETEINNKVSDLLQLKLDTSETYTAILNNIDNIKDYQNSITEKENEILINLNNYKILLIETVNNLNTLMENQSNYEDKNILEYTINQINVSIQKIDELNEECLEYIEESKNLIDLIDKQYYYSEMLTWFKLFRYAMTESYLHYQSNADLWSNKQKTYGTQTLEYPIK